MRRRHPSARFAALALALALLCGAPARAAAAPVTFSLEAPGAEVVALAGEFNDWQPAPMERSGEGVWTAERDLPPGDYGYKFVVDGEWRLDPGADGTKTVDGVRNSKMSVPADGNAAPPDAEREWKDSLSGRTIRARLVEADGRSATLRMDGRDYTVRVERLRPSDRAFIQRWRAARRSAEGENSGGTGDAGGGTPFDAGLEPGRKHGFTLPMPERVRFDFADHGYYPARGEERMRVALALPADFDPSDRSNHIAIVSMTADGSASSVEHMDQYYPAATRLGWVCLAVDIAGDEAKRKEWNGMDHRYTLLHNALEAMHAAWPASEDWRYATFGFSGGGGYSIWLGAKLADERYELAGVWPGGSHYTDSHIKSAIDPPRAFYDARLFISLGTGDHLITPEITQRVRTWAEAAFDEVRFERYDGGHSIHPPHVEDALRWFRE